MRCPYCQSEDTQVKDSRPAEDGAAIRRRRVCPDCGGRFTTFERVQLRDLVVVKKSGRKVPFSRDKLLRSVEIAMRKRNVDPERIDRAVTGIVRQLESSGETEVAVGRDRPAGHGGAEVARRRRLCALRLGLSQFPRGQGFSRRARRAAAATRTPAERWPAQTDSAEQEALDRRFMAAAIRLSRSIAG